MFPVKSKVVVTGAGVKVAEGSGEGAGVAVAVAGTANVGEGLAVTGGAAASRPGSSVGVAGFGGRGGGWLRQAANSQKRQRVRWRIRNGKRISQGSSDKGLRV